MRRFVCCFLLVLLGIVVHAAPLKVAAAYPYIAALVREIGGEYVQVIPLASGNWDPHQVIPRPSFIARMRDADLLVINGAQLEIGWLPPLLQQAANPRIQPGRPGFLDLSRYVTRIDIPAAVSRADGDVHPDGNPHFALDPHVIPALADALARRLKEVDAAHSTAYEARQSDFLRRFRQRLQEWDTRMTGLRGTTVVAYHRLYDYFLQRYGIATAGFIEPLPGISPTPRHIAALIERMKQNNIRLILQDVYHSDQAARFLAEKTGARIVVLPHDLEAVPGIADLFSWYETILRRLGR